MPGLIATLTVHERRKQADGPMAPVVPPVPTFAAFNSALRARAGKDILAAGLLTGALGMGSRALLAGRYLFGRHLDSNERPHLPSEEIELAHPVFADPAEKKKREKRAEDTWLPRNLGRTLLGLEASKLKQIPWYYPGMALAGLGSMVGGYRLADSYIDKKRKQDLGDETAEAKKDYEKALLGAYPRPAAGLKAAASLEGSERTGWLLDLIADRAGIDKTASLAGALKQANFVGTLLGMYGAAAVPLALLAGAATYKYTRDRSSDKLLDKALEQRDRQRALRRPPEVSVVSVPVRMRHGAAAEEQPDEKPRTQEP